MTVVHRTLTLRSGVANADATSIHSTLETASPARASEDSPKETMRMISYTPTVNRSSRPTRWTPRTKLRHCCPSSSKTPNGQELSSTKKQIHSASEVNQGLIPQVIIAILISQEFTHMIGINSNRNKFNPPKIPP